ncbi:MAG TPA: TIR domain-containing protein [Mycobacterium sp.]|nr:TIR domain-containing protein [Mycobacterium sp.]
MKHFFISYTSSDRRWAEWIAWELEHAGFDVFIQAWDILPGSNFVTQMRLASQECERTIAILSNAYLQSVYAESEWNAAFADDPTGENRKLIPVRIEDCKPRGIDRPIVYLDFVGLREDQARDQLLNCITEARLKPQERPASPFDVPEFPGSDHSPESESAPSWNVGIVSTEFIGLSRQKDLTYEANELQLEFGLLGATVYLLDPLRIALGIRDGNAAVGYVDEKEVNWEFFDSLDTLLVRRTRADDTSISDAIYDLISFLPETNPSLDIIDPPKSFTKPISKVPSLLQRAKAGISQGTRLVASRKAIQRMSSTFEYPVVVKPVRGWQGIGVQKCSNAAELATYLQRTDNDGSGDSEFPVIIERLLPVEDEFRVIVVGDEVIGCVSKKEVPGEVARNRAKGSSWTLADAREVTELAKAATRAHRISIAGVDIVRTDQGYVVIECNRNPQFAAFDRASGQTVAKNIASYALQTHRASRKPNVSP